MSVAANYPFDMTDKTFTLDINGYEYEFPYWTYPWIKLAVGYLKEGGVPLNLRGPGGIDVWIKPEYEVNFVFLDPRDPEIPERLTEYQRHQFMDIFEGDRRYGYRVLDVDDDNGEPAFFEWDDPIERARRTGNS